MNVTPHGHPSTLLAPGTMVAGYRIEATLGHGGMSVVYEATQTSLDRTIALKLLAAHLGADDVFRERFRREGLIQARLDHPNIVTLHEAGESDFGLFLAMRLVRGPRLKDLILAGELDARRSIALLEPIADALDSAHARGLVHRDVKPQNILVGARDHPYLADFGLTKLTGEHSLTASGEFVGTLDYISPEQIAGERPTARSDGYSFAATLYESLTGAVPFPGESQAAVLYGHLSEPAPRVTERQPELPAVLDGVIARGLAKEPRDRYRSATELIRETQRAFGDGVPSIRQPAPARARPEAATLYPDEVAAPPLPRAGRPRRPIAWAAAVLLAVLAAVAGAVIGGSGGAPMVASRSATARVALTRPEGWSRAPKASQVEGIELRNGVELTAPGEGGRDGIAAGHVETAGPLLLPSSFVRRLPHAPSRAAAVELGGLQALRYSDLAPRHSTSRFTLYAVPDSHGVATVVCFASRSSAREFLPRCERVAATLRVNGAQTYPVAPNGRYAQALSAVLGPLAARTRAARRDLSAAGRPHAQVRAAGRLASLDADAARRIAAIHAPVAAHRMQRALRSALTRAAAAYGRMSGAVAASDGALYARAVRRAKRAEAALGVAIAALRQLGYSGR